MKKNLLYALGLALLLGSCDQAQTSEQATQTTTGQGSPPIAVNNPNTAAPQEMASSENAPIMTFEESEHDFGNITQQKKVQHTFAFKNTGKSPLIIQSASAMCGCTVPEWPKEPVAPGESGKISVEFDPQGKMGQQSKQVTIRANTQPEIVQLLIKANIQENTAQAGANGPFRTN